MTFSCLILNFKYEKGWSLNLKLVSTIAILIFCTNSILAEANHSETQIESVGINTPKQQLKKANSLYRKKKYIEALNLYAELIAANSSYRNYAYFFSAKVYEARGMPEISYDYLKRIDQNKIKEKFKRKIEAYISRLEEKIVKPEPKFSNSIKRLNFFLEISSGKNSNPAFETSPDGSSDSQLNLDASMKYIYSYTNNYDLSLKYIFNRESYSVNSSENTIYHSFYLPMSYYTKNVRYRISPSFTYSYYGGQDYTKTYGSNFDLSFNSGKNSFSFYVQHLVLGSLEQENYAYLDGNSNKMKVTWIRRFQKSQFSSYLSYSRYNYSDTDLEVYSYSSPNFGLNYSLYYSKIDFYSGIWFEKRTYDEDSSGLIRIDNLKNARVQFGWSFAKYIRSFLNIEYAANSSSDSDNDYEQVITSLGISSGF